MSMKEESFFVKKLQHQDINIFKFRKNPKDQCFMSGWEQLQKHRFAFDFPKGLTNKKIN